MDRSRDLPHLVGDAANSLYSDFLYNIQDAAAWANYQPDTLLAYYEYFKPLATREAVPTKYQGTEHMIDVDGSRKDTFNKCYHTKIVSVNNPFGMAIDQSRYSWRGTVLPFRREPAAANNVLAPSLNLLENISIDQFKSRAYASMQPRFHGDVSLVNSLFELKDFRDIAKTILKGDLIKKISNYSSYGAYAKKKRGGNPRLVDPTATAAELGLTYNYAIVPTLRDALDIIAQMKDIVEQKQREFQEAGKTVQTTHYTEVTVHEDSRVVPSVGDYFWKQTGSLVKTNLTATLKYKYDYLLRSKTAAFMKYWGLTGNVEAAWNMLPWSFLLDYIAKIGQAIHFAERDANVAMDLFQYGESVKITNTMGTWFHTHSRLKHVVHNGVIIDPNQASNYLLDGRTASVYFRYPATPFRGLIVPRLHSPSDLQLFNIAALARCMFQQ